MRLKNEGTGSPKGEGEGVRERERERERERCVRELKLKVLEGVVTLQIPSNHFPHPL